jgi:putative zinc finger protein
LLTPENPHIEASVLTGYITGILSETETAAVEEHLLICENCRQRLDEAEYKYVAGEAARRIQRRSLADPAPIKGLRSKSAWILALAASVALIFLIPGKNKPTVYTDVHLESVRGPSAGIVKAEAGKPLRLHLDLTELSGNPLRLEIADHEGKTVWRTPTELPYEKNLAVALDKKLRPGSYWVRVYGVQSRLLREFGLRLE